MSHLDPTPEERDREGKLPTWAQETLRSVRASARTARIGREHAERKLDELETRIAEAAESETGPADSTAWLWRETDAEVLPKLGLGAKATVSFLSTGDGEPSIDVSVINGVVTIDAIGELLVEPVAPHRLRIHFAEDYGRPRA